MTSLTLHTPDATMKTAALQYAERGWHVLPIYPAIGATCGCGVPTCATPGKHPIGALVNRGLHNASAFSAHITNWWTQWPDANIAIRTGSASNLVVIDLDDRPNDGREGMATWRRLVTAYNYGQSPETVEAITGGGGRHLYFIAPPGVLIVSSKDHLGPGVEVKAEGGYVVAPPSTHISGRAYTWEASSHPDDIEVAPLPDWLLALLKTRQPRTDSTAPRQTAEMHPLEIAELQSALLTFPSDDRDVWVQTGMALHATGDDANGFQLWHDWSSTSTKYQGESDCRKTWASFHEKLDGVTVASIYQRATKAHWQRPSLAEMASSAGIELPDFSALFQTIQPVRIQPAALLPAADPLRSPLPGQLATIADWSLSTAPHPVHEYATVAALALGSTLCARRYATDMGNFSSLYFLAVGKSGTGKEHVRKTIEDVLIASDVPFMYGPPRWTSDSAVFSGLLIAPQQCAVLDEFGHFLEAASSKGDASTMKDGVLRELMELYGRLNGRAHSPQFATLSLSAKQTEETKRKVIDRPAQTLVGLTTPAKWYGSLRSIRVADGFLNRLCVIETDVERKDYAIPSLDPVPTSVQDWARQLLAPTCELDSLTRIANIPDPVRLAITPDAHVLFTAFRRDCNRLADRLEADLLGELPMRAAEQAMRLALIASLADDPTRRHVGASAADWGVAVASSLLNKLVPAVKARMADSALAALRKGFVVEIAARGEQGMTEREIKRHALFSGVTRRDREEIIGWALEAHYVTWGVRTHDGAGRPARVLRKSDAILSPEEAA